MKKRLSVLVMLFAIAFSAVFFTDNVKAADNNSITKVEKLKVKKISDKEFDKKVKAGQASGKIKAGQVTSKKAFISEFQKNAVMRKKTFTIQCSSFNVVESNVYDYLDQIDSKKTSDDSDFLKGGILNLGWTGYVNSSGQAIIDCKMVYTEDASQIKKVNKQSKKILKKLKVSGMSDVAKVKVIHDYVVKLVTYDNTLKDHSAYGGLAASKHSTVCQGYALIMYKLLTDAGVPVHYVTGDAGGPHAWNIVKIKGKWYYLDATWDDPSDTTVYDYFLVGSKTLSKDHKTDKYYTSKYKIASSNLNWKSLIKKSKKKKDKKVKTTQTKKEIEEGKDSLARAEVIQMLNESLDEALNEDPEASDYEVQMYDLCKKIFGFIIEDLSDEAFNALLENDEMLSVYTDETLAYIEEYILNPMVSYMDSEEFSNDLMTALYEDFGEEELSGLSEEELDSILDAYAYEAFTELLYAQSEEYAQAIVDAMVDKLNSMV
ncbi:MAG: hypothetical protein K5656_08575 [Lachnospiraceae bacterium]|nr:hypothetical protein [Lachnospiraceae bacterium]